MKVLLVNKFYYRRGGAETYLLSLAELLKSHGHEVAIFSMAHPDNLPSPWSKYFISEVKLDQQQGLAKDLQTAGHYFYSLEAKKKVAALVKDFKPDVVHLQNFAHQLTPSIISVFRKHKIPVVWTLHDYQLICPNYRLYTQGAVCDRCYRYHYYNACLHRCVHNSYLQGAWAGLEQTAVKIYGGYRRGIQTYIAPSKFMQEVCQDWGVKKEIRQIYNFIDLAQFEAISTVGDYLVYAGRLVPEKGILTLVKAVLALPQAKLQILGEGPLQDEILALTKGQKNIKVLGRVAGDQVKEIISGARAVVVPSEWYENNPYSVLEAQALGKVVVATKLGGLPELITDQYDGFVFSAGVVDELKLVLEKIYKLSDSELVLRGEQARARARLNYSPEKHYGELMKVYTTLVGV
ncbi:MAG: glycosyltransferase [Patescibacteria group bacterium]